ncbi:MAG: flagellar basal body P-ring protein FlgI [Planctomycetota bacterium]|nr:flagellar basal body P-ring protein FlgI [Planctomycetota bacterium]
MEAPPPPKVVQLAPPSVRIKDLAELQGVRENQLIGNGLVVGLDGTGDKNSNLTNQELANLTTRFGVKISASDIKSNNVAAVLVTAQLPPFAKKGAKIDVQISSIGDAKSLQGGILLQCPLVGADGRVYTVAQGAISVGGFSAGSSGAGGASVQKNHPLVGRIPGGGLVEREVPSDVAREGMVRMRLRNPDFTTAQRIADSVNKVWAGSAKALDLSSVEVKIPDKFLAENDLVQFVSQLETINVVPDNIARVVINERTGTIVAGTHVQIAPVAISHGNLYITIKNAPVISQPEALSTGGGTVVTNDQTTRATEESARVIVLQHGPTLGDLAQALNALKVTPRDIIAIFQALKNAGALHAELVIM